MRGAGRGEVVQVVDQSVQLPSGVGMVPGVALEEPSPTGILIQQFLRVLIPAQASRVGPSGRDASQASVRGLDLSHRTQDGPVDKVGVETFPRRRRLLLGQDEVVHIFLRVEQPRPGEGELLGSGQKTADGVFRGVGMLLVPDAQSDVEQGHVPHSHLGLRQLHMARPRLDATRPHVVEIGAKGPSRSSTSDPSGSFLRRRQREDLVRQLLVRLSHSQVDQRGLWQGLAP